MNNHDIVTKISLIAKVVQSGSNRPKWCKKSTMFRPQNSVCLFIGGYPVAHILTVKLKRNSSNCIQFNQEGVKKYLMQHIKKWACRRFVDLVFVVNVSILCCDMKGVGMRSVLCRRHKTNLGLRAFSIDIIFINIHLHKYPLGFSNDIPRNGPRPPENTTGTDHLPYLRITPQPAIFLELTVINIITINVIIMVNIIMVTLRRSINILNIITINSLNIIILVIVIMVTLRRSWYLVSLCMGLSR